jgi:PIN domain nuclease of toxin-antitoxin system
MISSAAHVHAFAQEAHPMQLQLCVGLHHDANRLARPCHHKSPMDLLSQMRNSDLLLTAKAADQSFAQVPETSSYGPCCLA